MNEIKEVILKCNSNIFGFQLKEGTKLIIDEFGKLGIFNFESNLFTTISLDFFQYNPSDFIKEGQRVNKLFDEISKEGGRLPLYEFEITNENKESHKKVTLFGMNYHLLTPNFGSYNDVFVKSFHPNISYLEYLQQSASQPFVIDFIKMESKNTRQLEQIIDYKTRDANGQELKIPIILQSYRGCDDESQNKLTVCDTKVIDGNSEFSFYMLPDTKLKMRIYAKKSKSIDSDTVSVLNSLLSCQIQQGIDFVSLENVKKFVGDKFDYGFSKNKIETELFSLIEGGYIDFRDGLYGYKFKILKIDGSVKDELTLTQVLKHSEYNLIN